MKKYSRAFKYWHLSIVYAYLCKLTPKQFPHFYTPHSFNTSTEENPGLPIPHRAVYLLQVFHVHNANPTRQKAYEQYIPKPKYQEEF